MDEQRREVQVALRRRAARRRPPGVRAARRSPGARACAGAAAGRRPAATASSRSTSAASRCGSSTLPARCAVARTYGGLERRASPRARAAGRGARRRPSRRRPGRPRPATPSRRRLSTAVCDGHEQQVAGVVGQDAVELLRHRAVERAHAGLDVRDRDARLRRRQRRRRASSSCRRRRARDPAGARRAAARAPRASARSARCSCRRGCPARPRGAGRPARATKTVDSSSSWCWPVWTSSSSWRSRSRRDTAAALTNCGRLPMTVTTFIYAELRRGSARRRRRRRRASAGPARAARARSIRRIGCTSRSVEARNASVTRRGRRCVVTRSWRAGDRDDVAARDRVEDVVVQRRRVELLAVERVEERASSGPRARGRAA